MTTPNDARRAEEIARGLTRSETIVICGGVTYSPAQRTKLIDAGLVCESARGERSLPRLSPRYAHKWALPLTELGHAVRNHLLSEREG